MRLPRLTTRWLMVIVAAFAVGLCIGRMVDLAKRYRQQAVIHRSKARFIMIGLDHATRLGRSRSDPIMVRLERWLPWAKHHAAMQIKYDRLACYPWLPVPPDPPEPK